MPKLNLFIRSFAILLTVLCLSGYLASRYPASAATQSQCDPLAGETFACLGEAINQEILDESHRTDENLARHTGGDTLMSLIVGINVMLVGVSESQAQEQQLPFNWPSNPYIQGGGALGTLARAVGTVYANPPTYLVNKTEFFQRALANNLLNPQPAYAQGYGTDLLKNLPFLQLWRLFRNVAYIALAAALAIFGLMVMLRAKADPRTTVTFQMALPRIAVALVLIYFSLPIAGLLMDVGEVGTKIVEGIFCTGAGCTIARPTYYADFKKIWDSFSILGQLDVHIDDKVDPFIKVLLSIFVLSVVLRLFWTLISRYVTLVLQVILGPINFVLSVLPGREEASARWVKEVLVNVLTFPGVLLIINIAYFVLETKPLAIPLPTIFRNPASATTTPLNLSGLMAVGILSLAPKIPAMLEEMLDVVPGAHVSRAGADAGSMLKGVPLVGKMMG